jgi:hypothetical protein
MMMSQFLLLFAFVLISTQLTAATYFVRTDGNDSCNGTVDTTGSTGNCAFRTLTKASTVAQAGDTVTIHGGSYAGFSTSKSGAAGSYITFKRAGTETVTVTGQVIVDHSYIVLDGLTTNFSGSYEGGAAIRAGYRSRVNHITVTNCRLSGNGANAFVTVFYADDVLFDANIMEGPTFFIGMVLNGQRHTITNNIFRNISDVERIFNVAVSNSVWRGNEIYNLSWTGKSSVHPDIWQSINDGSVAQNNIIENNYIHDTSNVQVGNTETNATGTNVSNWTFRNNVFANSGTFYVHTRDFKFYNNTYYRTSASGQAAILLYKDGWGDGSGAEFKNNIFVQNSNQGTYGVSGGSPSYSGDYNLIANTDFTARSTSEPHAVKGGNPQFTAVSSNCISTTCDFRIKSSSAALDKGTSLPGVVADKDGVSRPQGAALDIGAYEYGGTPVSVLPPTNLTAAVQ